MTSIDHKRIVVVDGYSTGRDLVPELLDRNVECLHLQSSQRLPSAVSKCFDASSYDADLGYVGDSAAAVEVLAGLQPHAVIAGSEWGVTFAEEVAHRLGLPTNRPDTITARRDKFEMIETLRQHGLHVAEQICTANVAEAQAWAARHGKWPIVVKPLASAGSDGLSICHSRADIDTAFARELGRINFMGGDNDRLLLQSFLSGPQFIVNAVSWNGRHYITDAWSQAGSMSGSAVVPHHISLLNLNGENATSLVNYTTAALDALGIENGASHSELKWTPQGPALIETGARLMGAAMDRASYLFAGTDSQAMVYAQLLSGSDRDREALFARRHYTQARHITKLLFNFEEAAEVASTDGLLRLRELPSFHAHYRPLAKGDRVWRTADWLCRGGVVYLVHNNRDQIAEDIDQFREWEQRGELYGLVPASVLAA